MTAIQDETEWIRRAASGDSEAFVTLCAAHRDRLWRVVSSVAPPSDRDDLAQETIVRAYRSIASYSGKAHFAAWLCRIAVNCAHDYRRSAWKRRIVSLFDLPEGQASCGESPHELAEKQDARRRIRQAVADLPEVQRVPIWLHYFDGFTIAEITRLEQIPEATIRGRIQSGLKRLSPHLKGLMEDTEVITEQNPQGAKGCEI